MPKDDDSKGEDSKFAVVVSWLFLLVFLGLCWYWGWQIGATALADPDTCWLLAVGKLILAKGIPVVDPFSWTAKTYAGPYLPYQWLSSISFYRLYSWLGAGSLLFFVSYVVLLSYFILPFFMARRLGVSLLLQGILSVLAVSAGSFHFPLRPELFSYLLVSLLTICLSWIVCFIPLKSEDLFDPPGGKLPLTTPPVKRTMNPLLAFSSGFALFVLWANLHSGFVLGLIILFVLILVCVIGKARAASSVAPGSIQPLCFILCGALPATLITPFQSRLYAYLPGLFFSPMNKFNQELLPLTLSSLFSSDYLPFLILQLFFVVSVAYLLKQAFRGRLSGLYLAPAIAFGLILAILFVASDLCRRLIPFAVLLCFPYFWTWSKAAAAPNLQHDTLSLASRINSVFARLIAGRGRFIAFLLASILFMTLGTSASNTVFPATIPQTTFAFYVPSEAVSFIQETRPAGNMLNDPQYGDVLIFNQGEKAQVFIDTRFDLYGPEFCRDYFIMANGLAGYEKLFQKYQIEWIFFPPQAPITIKLAKDPLWKIVYQKNTAVIMVKQK